jgi:hypothetical protein
LKPGINVTERPSRLGVAPSTERRLEPVRRQYRPGSAALAELVEALYRLLMDTPPGESAPDRSTCFPAARE